MSTSKWSLYQKGTRFHADEVRLEQCPAFAFQLQRLTGGLSEGVDVLTVKNGRLEIKILPTRGMGVWDMTYDGVRIGWQSPVPGPVHPSFVNLADPSGLGWLDGFDELVVRCGLQSNGAPEFSDTGQLRRPLHGRIANLPARSVEVEFDAESQEVTVTGVAEEVRFHFSKLRLVSRLTTRLGQKGFTLNDSVENLSEAPAEAQLLYHINIGRPILDAGSRLVAPVEIAAPRDEFSSRSMVSWSTVDPPGASLTEQAYYLRLLANDQANASVLLQDSTAKQGVGLTYDAGTLPCLTFWKNPRAASDGYVVGIEPGSNYPNPSAFEKQQGRAWKLPPYGSVNCHLRFEYYATAGEVKSAAAAIGIAQGGFQPNVMSQPRDGWSPPA
jgi:hypothetical protein